MRTFIGLAIPAITFLLLASVGLDLKPEDFARVQRQRLIVLAGLIGPLLLLPPVAFSLIRVFRPPTAVEAGLLLIVACPIGGISNTYSYLARASTALSVTLTALSCLLAVAAIPILAALFEDWLGRPLGFAAPSGVLLTQLLLMLALPVGLGMFVRRRWPRLADQHRPALQRLAFGLLVCLVGIVIYDQYDLFVRELRTTVLLAATFVVVSFGIGWLTGLGVQADARDRFTLSAEFATRNVAIATAIAVTLVGQVEFAVFATIYFLTELPLMLGAVTIFRYYRAPVA
jgi:BASS family bile acid:Na+ symporter